LAAYRAMTMGELLAWDPVAQTARWRVPHAFPGNGGVLATAGNLVFQGTVEGERAAYRADTGEKVWSFQGHDAIIAPPIAYEIAGEQYIAVMAGYGGSNGVSSPFPGSAAVAPNGQLLAFKLGG